MARTKISEFSANPANNTDIDSINIAEGCAPSGINDAIRELMAQLKDWQSGTSNDPYVVGSSGSLTLSYGTANGVPYLNGSKVLTSGSVLSFDGAILGVNGVSVGRGAGAVATNTAVGASALAANTTGLANAAFSQNALVSNTTGNYNTAVGRNTLYTNTTGSTNTAVGVETLYTNTTGASNVGVGYQSLVSNTTASESTAVGYQAGYYQSTGSLNTYIGRASGYLITTGSKNTVLGCYSGNQGGLDIRTASNYIVLSDGDGNPRGIFDGSGNLLVGATSANGVGWTLNPNGSGQIRSSGTGSQDKIQFANSNGVVGAITTNGTSTSYFTSSDYRLKNTVSPMTGALAKVALLKPCTYKWNTDGSDGEGFIAHELAEVCPNAVSGEKDAVDANGNPKYQGIDTSFLVATLTAALQELNAKFDAYVAAHP